MFVVPPYLLLVTAMTGIPVQLTLLSVQLKARPETNRTQAPDRLDYTRNKPLMQTCALPFLNIFKYRFTH